MQRQKTPTHNGAHMSCVSVGIGTWLQSTSRLTPYFFPQRSSNSQIIIQVTGITTRYTLTHIHTPWFMYLYAYIGWVEAWTVMCMNEPWTFVFGFSERPNTKAQQLYWDVMCMKGMGWRGSPTRGTVCVGLHSKSLHSALYSFKTVACICLQTT